MFMHTAGESMIILMHKKRICKINHQLSVIQTTLNSLIRVCCFSFPILSDFLLSFKPIFKSLLAWPLACSLSGYCTIIPFKTRAVSIVFTEKIYLLIFSCSRLFPLH